MYDENFKINDKLIELLNGYIAKKILVVKGFAEKAREVLKDYGFEVFSLENEGKIKKEDKNFFIKLFEKYSLTSESVIYIDHSVNNLNGAKEAGIRKSILYNKSCFISFFIFPFILFIKFSFSFF